MSYRTLTQTLFRIDAAVDAATGGRQLCARRGCWADALTWLSPYCSPGCTRAVAGWLPKARHADVIAPGSVNGHDHAVPDDEVVYEPFMPGTAWEVTAEKPRPRPRPPWWRQLLAAVREVL